MWGLCLQRWREALQFTWVSGISWNMEALNGVTTLKDIHTLRKWVEVRDENGTRRATKPAAHACTQWTTGIWMDFEFIGDRHIYIYIHTLAQENPNIFSILLVVFLWKQQVWIQRVFGKIPKDHPVLDPNPDDPYEELISAEPPLNNGAAAHRAINACHRRFQRHLSTEET